MRLRKNTNSNVAIIRNPNEAIAITEGLNLINASDLIDQNDFVVITPNWVNSKKPNPNEGVIVGQESLRSIIRFVKQKNPKKIIIATGSANGDTPTIMKLVGYDKIISEENVEFIDLNYGPYTTISLNHYMPNSTQVNSLINQMTVLISFTQLKHHEESTISGVIKNIALGWPPAEIHGTPKKNLGIHNDLHGFIRSMAENIPIDISILSASPVMIGTGPTKGISKHTEFVICGTDPVSVDTIGASLLGFKPQAISYLYQCSNINLGESLIDKINISGIDLALAQKTFSKIVYGDEIIL